MSAMSRKIFHKSAGHFMIRLEIVLLKIACLHHLLKRFEGTLPADGTKSALANGLRRDNIGLATDLTASSKPEPIR